MQNLNQSIDNKGIRRYDLGLRTIVIRVVHMLVYGKSSLSFLVIFAYLIICFVRSLSLVELFIVFIDLLKADPSD